MTMNHRFLGAAAAVLAAVVSMTTPAAAAPPCTKEPRSQWLTEAAMRDKIAVLGYRDIRVFKISGTCYEIYGTNAQGRKAEVYFNPIDGAVVKANVD